jgi:Ni/Fe-hydrogenase subunit HybB-like protein
MLTSGSLSVNFWGGEIIFGILVPMIILLSSRLRQKESLHILALLFIIGGLVAFRWNTNMAGQLVLLADLTGGTAASYTSYVPSLIEIAAGAGVIAYGVLAVTLGIRFFSIVDHSGVEETEELPESIPAQGTLVATD